MAIKFICSQHSFLSIVCYPGNFTALEDPDFKVKEVDLRHEARGHQGRLFVSVTKLLDFFLSFFYFFLKEGDRHHFFFLTAGCKSELGICP